MSDKTVVDRFLRYVSFDTQSDSRSSAIPSTAGQLTLANELVKELLALGISDACCDETGRVYAHIPASQGVSAPGLALIAHLDTAMDMSGKDVKPRIIKKYDGGDIVLNAEKNIVTRVAEHPELLDYLGQDLIVTDGTTLLGADDKAGVAEIMQLASFLIAHPDHPHPRICIHFTCDEEIGRGADHTDLEKLGAAYAYTVDGGRPGEFSYENFNAASATLTFHGITAHTGYAKGVMRSAMLVAIEYHALLPAFENPACTEGREGFYHLDHMEGCTETAVLQYLIRDHDLTKYEERKAFMQDAVTFINRKYGQGTCDVRIEESYLNMYEKVKDHKELISHVMDAMSDIGMDTIVDPIRGGTDGSRLSYMGLPCPNLCTGGHNGHGRHEFVSCQGMEAIVELLKALVRRFA